MFQPQGAVLLQLDTIVTPDTLISRARESADPARAQPQFRSRARMSAPPPRRNAQLLLPPDRL